MAQSGSREALKFSLRNGREMSITSQRGNKLASKLLGLIGLALAALACNPAGEHMGTVWLDARSPARAAQDAWGLALAFEPTIETVPQADIPRLCKSATLSACTNYESHTIYLPREASDEKRFALLLHEIGHAIRPELPHLTEGCEKTDPSVTYSHNVMCANISGTLQFPTEADQAWALQGGDVLQKVDIDPASDDMGT